MEISDHIKNLYSELDDKSDLDELDIKKLHDASFTEQERGIMQKEFCKNIRQRIVCIDLIKFPLSAVFSIVNTVRIEKNDRIDV